MTIITRKSKVDSITEAWLNSPYHKAYNVKHDKDHANRTEYYKLHILSGNKK